LAFIALAQVESLVSAWGLASADLGYALRSTKLLIKRNINRTTSVTLPHLIIVIDWVKPAAMNDII
jgi:hypothetical protein